MVKLVPVSFRNHRGLLMRGMVHVPKEYDTAIVFLHGFPGDMDGYSKRFSTALSKKGHLCMRFDFSCGGSSQGAFEDKLMSDEVKDVKAAIDFLCKHYSVRRLVLMGNSTGAIDASLYAHKDKRIKGLVLAGAVCRLDTAVHYDFSDAQVRDFWTKGHTYVQYLKPWMPKRGKINKPFYDEFFKLDIPKAMKGYRRPLLIIHGEKDTAIPVSEARALYANANKPKKLLIIPGADHSLKKNGARTTAAAAIDRFIRSL